MNQKISALNSLDNTTIVSADLIPVVDSSATETKKIAFSEMMNVDDSILTIHDNLDTTKKAQFQASGITAGQTRVFTLPDANTTLVGADTAQSLSNKTLITPTIADFTNAQHDHQDSDDGGQLDHGLALTASSLGDDDHLQYALLAGRATGQVLTGGTASGDDLTLRSTTNATKGDVFIQDQGGNVIVGGGTTASEVRLLEPSASGTNYTAFKTQAQAGNITYTLPAVSGATGTALTDVAGNGTLSWAASGNPTCKTTLPLPNGYPLNPSATSPSGTVVTNTNTTLFVGQVMVPYGITVNKITIRSGATVTTPGTVDITLYSEDGQTQLFSVTTASIDTINTLYTTAVSSVSVPAGIYYIAINPNSTTDITTYYWNTETDPPFGTTAGFGGNVTSEPILEGTVTITAGTPPATIDPTAITSVISRTLTFRLDN